MTADTWPALSLADAHRALSVPGSPFEMIEITVRGLPMRTWKNAPGTARP